MERHILVIGSLNMDLVISADHLPAEGETVIEGQFHTYAGGKGANQAIAAARMGGRVKMVGRVGDDDYGRQLVAGLSSAGVETCFISKDKNDPTGVAVITVDRIGKNSIVVASGANMSLKEACIKDIPDLFNGVGVMVAQLEIPIPVVQAAYKAARERGVITILNPAPARTLTDELFPLIDYIIPNRLELEMLTGEKDLHAGISRLLASGVGTVIVTLGEDGAFLATRKKQAHIAAFKVNAVDTVAAGDAFTGAFCVGLVEELPIEDCVRLANAVAAISVTRKGAQPSMPTRAEAREFMKSHK